MSISGVTENSNWISFSDTINFSRSMQELQPCFTEWEFINRLN